MSETTVTKFVIRGNANLINDVKEGKLATRVLDGNIENMSMVFAQPGNVQPILNEFDVKLRYKEDFGVSREVGLEVKPIKVRVTLKQLIFFRKFADQIGSEASSLDFGPSGVPPPPQETPASSSEPASLDLNQALATKLQLSANMQLINLTLEDDLTPWRYPLIKLWAAHMSVTGAVDPKKEKRFTAQLFEMAIELGKMYNPDKAKYQGVSPPKPMATFKGDTEVYPPYKELM